MPSSVETIEYFPAQIFRDRLASCTIQSAFIAGTTGANQSVIAGVAGKVIRVVSGIFHSQSSGVALLAFLDATGGTILANFSAPSNALPPFLLPFNPAGWFDTSVGNGLFLTGSTTASLVSLRYITFTP